MEGGWTHTHSLWGLRGLLEEYGTLTFGILSGNNCVPLEGNAKGRSSKRADEKPRGYFRIKSFEPRSGGNTETLFQAAVRNHGCRFKERAMRLNGSFIAIRPKNFPLVDQIGDTLLHYFELIPLPWLSAFIRHTLIVSQSNLSGK